MLEHKIVIPIKDSSSQVLNLPTQQQTLKSEIKLSERMPGKATDLVLQLFSRGESFDPDGFITFFTDTPVYQFGNFEVCFDKAAIKKSAENFLSRISAVYHEIKMMWESGNTVFVEMDITYWRKDGSIICLPCCDIFRLEGDKFSEQWCNHQYVISPLVCHSKNRRTLCSFKGGNHCFNSQHGY
ncbi:hypothetical protein BZZ01_00445 [Nostocales cyanobacterium HT-58-2]|nr:hypothetical protein BZZ01_00445 [Nostocales cyanobacterium HT-58-2]